MAMTRDLLASPCRSVGRVQNLRARGSWFDPWPLPIFFPRIEHSHFERIHALLIAVYCFDDGYKGKQPWFGKIRITPGKHR